MKFIISILILAMLCGCSKGPLTAEDFHAKAMELEKSYYESPVAEAKETLWMIIRTDERALHEDRTGRLKPGMDVYGLAISYTRLAMIAEAEDQKETSDAFFSIALRYWSEVADLTRDKRMKINRRMAVWAIDSLEHEYVPRWRRDLNHPPKLYYPKFQANAEGDIVQSE